jgi:thimet oligopeptidase
MAIYQDLLGMKFVRLDGVPTWHQDVKVYQVLDKASGSVMGHFYLDLHPRDNKYGHAAVFPLLPRAVIDGKIKTPSAAMVTNFDKPLEGKPSLLQHSEVITFFHEFGHIMHNMATEATIKWDRLLAKHAMLPAFNTKSRRSYLHQTHM